MQFIGALNSFSVHLLLKVSTDYEVIKETADIEMGKKTYWQKEQCNNYARKCSEKRADQLFSNIVLCEAVNLEDQIAMESCIEMAKKQQYKVQLRSSKLF